MRNNALSLRSANFQKVVSLTLITANLLVIALVVVVLANIRQQMVDRATIATQNLAYTLDQSLTGVIDHIDMTLVLSRDEIERQLAADGALDAVATGKHLDRLQTLMPSVMHLWISDARGQIIHGAQLPASLAAALGGFAGSADFARLTGDAGTGLVMGGPVTLPQAGNQALMPFARRINAADGSFAGAVYGLVALDEFEMKFAELKLGPDDAVELRDGALKVIMRHPAIPQDASGSADKTKDNRIYHYRKLTRYPLFINVGLDQDEFLSPWRKGFFAATAGVVFFMLASLVVARMLLRSWTRQNATVESLAASKQALQEGERRWRKIFDQSPIGAAVMAPDHQFVSVNETLCRILGYSREELLARNFRSIAHPDELPHEMKQMQQLLDGEIEQYANESRYLGKDGQVVWTQVSMSLVRDGNGQPQYFLPMVQDIGTRKQAEEQINYLAYHDALTGLPNRQLAKDRLDHAIAYAAREKSGVGVLHLDLDHFKAINDSLGHPVGDALIKEVAAKLQDCVRDTDTIARLGGDEFLIILANVSDPEIISSIAVKVQESLGTPAPRPWWQPLPQVRPASPVHRIARDVTWAGKHLAPWVGRRLTGRSSGDGIAPKRPRPAPVSS